MSSSAIDAVPTGALDRWGLTVTTSTRNGFDPRVGGMYDPLRMAAAVPVHFHAVNGPNYLALLNGYWNAATPSGVTPGHYTAHSAVIGPAAVMINASTGDIATPLGLSSYALPTSSPAATLVDAASSATFLFALLVPASGPVILAHFRLTPDGQVVAQREYPIATVLADSGKTVVFDRGVFVDGPWVYLWGSDSDGLVYSSRALLGRLGGAWQMQSNDGWTDRVQDNGRVHLTPVGGLVSQGPVSTLVFRGRTYVGVVINGSGEVWVSRSMSEPWTRLRSVPTVTGVLQGGLSLQPQINASPDQMPADVITAVPMVHTTLDTSGGTAALLVSWDLLSIPRALA